MAINLGPSGLTLGSTTINDWDDVEDSVKSWVSIQGTGTVTIRDSFNASSVTDNASGDYTLNFSTAMSDANYAFAVAGSGTGANGFGGGREGTNQVSGSVRFGVWDFPNLSDQTYVNCLVVK